MDREDATRKLELISATVHELKTPLTLIHGMGSMLESQSHGSLNQQQAQQVQSIIKASHRLSALVESLLHVENLPYTQNTQPVQIYSELHVVLGELKESAQAKHITLAWDKKRALPPVLADPASVYQLLSHILSTSIKHAPANSQISIRTHKRGKMVVLQVTAPGVNIKPSEARSITALVGKQRQPVRNQGASSGLSWYIVKSIIEFYAGKLQITTRRGHTVITMRLPESGQLSLFA